MKNYIEIATEPQPSSYNKILIFTKNKMTIADEHIVATYSKLFEGLSSMNKIKLIEKLSRSISEEKKNKEKDFYKSFGAFSSEKSAEEIIKEIKESRNCFKRN